MSEDSAGQLNLLVVAPLIALALTGFVAVAIGLLRRKIARALLLGLVIIGMAISIAYTVQLWGLNTTAFGGLVAADDFALVFNVVFVFGAALCLLLALNAHEQSYLLYHEFFAIVLFATVGMMLMASSTNLLTIFLGLETLSVSLYILAGFKRTEGRSLESAFKYFLLGAFSSAFLLYGIALIYGALGTLDLSEVAHLIVSATITREPLLLLGGVLIVVGLGFKVAVAPFHMWAPDVYEGAPTPISAFMSTGSKAAGFAALLRVLFSATDGMASDWISVLAVLAVLTMTLGNIGAIVQGNLKRMLAYSSVAHAGYILVGVVAWNEVGAASVIFYLVCYTFMNIGAFGVISAVSSAKKEYIDLQDFRGLAFQRPYVALLMAVFMFSLAGLPPTAGFVGKFYLFSAAVKAGQIPLVIIAVLNSLISLYYYLGVVVVMFMKESDTEAVPKTAPSPVFLSLGLSAVATLILGIFPSRLMDEFQFVVNHMLY